MRAPLFGWNGFGALPRASSGVASRSLLPFALPMFACRAASAVEQASSERAPAERQPRGFGHDRRAPHLPTPYAASLRRPSQRIRQRNSLRYRCRGAYRGVSCTHHSGHLPASVWTAPQWSNRRAHSRASSTRSGGVGGHAGGRDISADLALGLRRAEPGR